MEYTISCEQFVRLAKIPLTLDPEDGKDYIKSLYIERSGGKMIVVATNVKIAAIEYLGECEPPYGDAINIALDPVLIERCEAEIAFNSSLTIVDNPMLKFASAKTTFGYSHPGNAAIYPDPAENQFLDWRTWLPKKMPTATHGAMFANLERLTALAAAAPTGKIVFPEHIDNRFPVIVRDIYDENWLGVFVPNSKGQKPGEDVERVPAVVPGWV